MAAHRYWRVYITEAAHASFLDIREIEMRTSVGGADVTGSGTAIASSADPSFPASSAFDNNSGTTWFTNIGSNPIPQWIGYDFGAGNDKDIVQLQLTSWSETEMWVSFKFQYSDDNVTWTTLWTIEYDEPLTGGSSRTYTATDTPTMNGAFTFWRVRATAVDGGSAFGVMEMQFRLTVGGADQATGGKAFASSSFDQANHLPGNAFDDLMTTKWASRTAPPAWLGYRWSGSKDIREVAVISRNDGNQNQAPTNFVIEYWDGAAYQTALSVTGQTGWASGETRTFSWGSVVPVTARPVVFICT